VTHCLKMFVIYCLCNIMRAGIINMFTTPTFFVVGKSITYNYPQYTFIVILSHVVLTGGMFMNT